MKLFISILVASILAFNSLVIKAEGLDYYFPDEISVDSAIPTPEEFLGYVVGTRVTEHSRINAYYEKLAELSDRAELIEIGKSHESRPIYVLAISSPENINNLNELKVLRQNVRKGSRVNSPLIIFLGNTVHGNEISGSESSLFSAYYYIASQSEKIINQLNESVIFIDPVRNPDGQERFASWINSNISFNRNNTSQYDREHSEGWPRGRGNHYWFDLNRDWVNIVHPESRARVALYQDWLPHVQADHHEMGTNTSFFFEPTDPEGNESHLIPKSNYKLNQLFAEYFADALNKIGSFYYTKESYDNKNPNFGSTYPDFNGGVGILFEQGSSRGLVQESDNGHLTLPFTIRNQLVTTIATVDAAHGNKDALFDLQNEFFTKPSASMDKRRSYIIGDAYDSERLNKFIELLLTHRLEVYENDNDVVIDSVTYYSGKSYIIPAVQPNSALVGIIFDDKIDFDDESKLGYGAGFSIAHSSGLSNGISNSVNRGNRVESVPNISNNGFQKSDYAYLIDFRNSGSQKLVLNLLENDINVKTGTKTFSINNQSGEKDFSYGSLLIPVSTQKIGSDELYETLKNLSAQSSVEIIPVNSGFNFKGVDLGSSSFRNIDKPKVLIVTGADISSTEAGEVWHLFDQQLHYPLTRVNAENFRRVPLNEFNRIVLVSGSYDFLNELQLDELKGWVKGGGTLITINGASQWAINNKISSESIVAQNDSNANNNRNSNGRSSRQPTSIFMSTIDLTNPLAFGLTSERLPVIRESNLFIASTPNSIATYDENPLLNGFISADNLNQLTQSSSITANRSGRGNVIQFADNPLFRGIWHGTSRTFVNAVLFGNLVNGR
ncbi:MAG: hypothetical protein ITF98_05180 [Fermentimonas sp.]|nr:hypothetical protein [Fermentimonas sp.]